MTKLFENINPKNIEKLKRFLRASTIKYQKSGNILSNVNQDNFIAIIDSGSVQLEYSDYDGNKVVIENLSQGDLFSTITYSLKNEEMSCITKEETSITYIEYDDIIFYIPKSDCLLSDINSQGLFYKAVDCVFNAEDNFDEFFDAFQYVTIYSTHGNYIPKEKKDFIVTVKIILENEAGEQFSINNEELHINSKDIYCDVSEKAQGSNTYLYKVENNNPYSLPIWNKIIKKTDFIEINSNIPKLEKNKIYFSKTITDFKTSQRTVMWRNFIESINKGISRNKVLTAGK